MTEIQTTSITPLGTWFSVIGCAAWLLGYNAWHFFGYWFYDLCVAVTIMFLIWSIHLSAVGWHLRLSRSFLIIAFSNVADELFFDPTQVQLNEYIAASIILLTVMLETQLRRIILYLQKSRAKCKRDS
jgi:hypothetical protein